MLKSFARTASIWTAVTLPALLCTAPVRADDLDANDRRARTTTAQATAVAISAPLIQVQTEARSNPFLGRTARNEELLVQLEEERLRTQIALERAQQARALREVTPATSAPPVPVLGPAPLTTSGTTTGIATAPAMPANASVTANVSTRVAAVPKGRRADLPLVEAPPVVVPPAQPAHRPVHAPPASPRLLGIVASSVGRGKHVMVAHAGRIVMIAEGEHAAGVRVGAVRPNGAFLNDQFVALSEEATRLRAPERMVAAAPPAAAATVSGGVSVPAMLTVPSTPHLDFAARP